MTALSLTFDPFGRWYQWPDGRSTPASFRASGPAGEDGCSLEVEVELDDLGQARCKSVRVEAVDPDGRVHSDSLRVPLSALVRDAVEAATVVLRQSEEGRCELVPVRRLRGQYRTLIARQVRLPRSGSPVTVEQLEAVAGLWRAATRAGDDPVQVLQVELSVSQATAYRWIARARREGLIPAGRGSRSRA
jgi:hypothetical protein